jgi:hypothetical protein
MDAPSVAVCVTGLQRSLLEPFVVGSYGEHIFEALSGSGWTVDSFLAVVLRDIATVNAATTSARARLKAAIELAYPHVRSLRFCSLKASENIQPAPTCNRVQTRATRDNKRGELSVLRQWYAIGACYTDVERYERTSRDGRRYSWLVRTRTDLVYFTPIPLAAVAAARAGSAAVAVHNDQHVYVPSGGMTIDAAFRCMNDLAFLCPRHLCRPYFRLLELWQSPYCNATHRVDADPTRGSSRSSSSSSSSGSSSSSSSSHLADLPAVEEEGASIFASPSGIANGQSGPATAPYVLPRPPIASYSGRTQVMSGQWYAFARYVARPALPCKERQLTSACCGRIREIRWPFGLRREGRVGFDCFYRLKRYVPVVSRYENVSEYLRLCWEAEAAERAGHGYCRTGECRRQHGSNTNSK